MTEHVPSYPHIHHGDIEDATHLIRPHRAISPIPIPYGSPEMPPECNLDTASNPEAWISVPRPKGVIVTAIR